MKSDTIFVIIIMLAILAATYINNNISFIGRGKKLILISLIAIIDLVVMYVNTHIFLIVKATSISEAATTILLSAIGTIIVLIISFVRALKIIAERKMEVTTLLNCTIHNMTFYYKIKGMSVQGKKNNFVLFCKDGKDFEAAMRNGINNFNIRYFSSTNRIESVTFMPNNLVQDSINDIVMDSVRNQEIKRKK